MPYLAAARGRRGHRRSAAHRGVCYRPRCGAPGTSPATPSALTWPTAPSPWHSPDGAAAGTRLGPAGDDARAACRAPCRSRASWHAKGFNEPRRGPVPARSSARRRWNWPTPATTRRCARPGAPSWWSARATRGTEVGRARDSCSPGPRCAATRGSARRSCAGCWWTRPPPSCPSWAPSSAARRCASCRRRGLDVRLETTIEEITGRVGPALRRDHRAHPHRRLVRRRDAAAAHPGARAGNRPWAHRGR